MTLKLKFRLCVGPQNSPPVEIVPTSGANQNSRDTPLFSKYKITRDPTFGNERRRGRRSPRPRPRPSNHRSPPRTFGLPARPRHSAIHTSPSVRTARREAPCHRTGAPFDHGDRDAGVRGGEGDGTFRCSRRGGSLCPIRCARLGEFLRGYHGLVLAVRLSCSQ